MDDLILPDETIENPSTQQSAQLNDEPVGSRGAVVVNMADVEPEPVEWLWLGRIALGKLTLIAGDPGLGKSFLTLDMAARVSAGRPWPDSSDGSNAIGGVVLLNAEDDAADTIRPRLDAAGADVSRINLIEAVRLQPAFDPQHGSSPSLVEAAFDLTRDLPALESTIEATPDCRLVVIDPITAYLGATDSHKNADLRGLLAPLSAMATRHRVAVVAVTHLNKNASGPAIYRTMGSLAFTAAARAAWVVTKDRDDAHRRLLLPVKNNLAPDVLGMAYKIETTETHGPAVQWEVDPIEITADDALRPAGDRSDEGDEASSFLREMLTRGQLPAKDVLTQAQQNGFHEKQMRKALRAIGGKCRRVGFGRGGAWYWFLPNANQ